MSWTAKPTKALLRELGGLGFTVDDRMRDGLKELLAAANGERRTGVLSPAELLQTILDATKSTDEVGFRAATGGDPVTACLVARANYQRWIVGVTTCKAANPTPAGCAGYRLSKWQDGGDNTKLLASWAMKFDVTKLGINVTPKPTATLTDEDRASEQELLAQIIAAPADDAPRLVYADWLAPRDPMKGEFIVLQCQLESLRGKQRAALEKRADELRIAHGDRWYPIWCRTTYRRGFPYAISTEVEPLIANGAKLFAASPLDYVALECKELGDLERFLSFTQLARVATLDLYVTYLDVGRVVDVLASTDRLGNVTSLGLRSSLTPKAATMLARPTTLPGLRTLRVAEAPSMVRRTLTPRSLQIVVE